MTRYFKMRNVFPICLTLFLVLVARPTVAGEFDWTVSAHADNASLDTVLKKPGPRWSGIDDDNNSRGFSLSYQPLSWMGVRLMYERSTGFTTFDVCPEVCLFVVIDPVESDLDVWTLGAMPRWNLNQHWSLYGIAGLSHWEVDTPGGILPGDSSTDLTIGGGIGWRPTSRIELGIEYQYGNFDYNAWRANLGFRF